MSFRINKKYHLSIFLIFLFCISFLLRFIGLTSYPQGFHFDEAVAGYNAYSLLESGSTAKNGPWPIYLDTFGDYRPMGIVYVMMPSIALFGLNEFAVRLPTAIIGALSPILLFFLVRLFTNRTPVAVISAILLALSPWHIMLSRATSEAVIAVAIAMLIALMAFLVKEKAKISHAILLYIFMAVSYITYHPINLFLLLLIPIFIVIYWTDMAKQKHARVLLVGVFALYLIFPFLTGIFFSNSTGRLSQVVDVFGQETQEHLQKQLIEEGVGSNVFIARVFHNKATNAGFSLGQRYLDYFSPDFLFFDGGLPKRYFTPDVGLINFLELLGLGIFFISFLSFEKKKKAMIFFISWLLIAPIAAAITTDDHPNVSRSVLMLPAIQVLSGYGLYIIFSRKFNKLMLVAALVIGAVGVWHYLYFFHQYVLHAKYYQWLDRSYPAKEAVQKISAIDRNKKVLVSTNFLGTDTFVLFYEKVDPVLAQQAYSDQGTRLKTLFNYTFIDDPCPTSIHPVGYDYVMEHHWCSEPTTYPVTPIPGADGSSAFKLVELPSTQTENNEVSEY